MTRKKIILLFILCVAVFFVMTFICLRQQKKEYYNLLTITGATPLAVNKDVPSDFTLTVNGLVKKSYSFSGPAMNAFAKTRIRTQEISPDGKFTGAYIYVGIPVFNILEGIAPEKPEKYTFDQPLDICVTFTSSSGQEARFSFNELIMTNDCLPVTLAYTRDQVLPTTEAVRDSYSYNLDKENLKGFRLICPKEPDTSRYLDDVVQITYTLFDVPENLLPPRKKKFKCVSESVLCIDKGETKPPALDRVERQKKERWLRIGHGRGYEDAVSAEGYSLGSFLKTNFPGCSENDFFLFVACDGYRSLFSGREIFKTYDGSQMMIANRVNEEKPPEGFMLAPTGDYFADRAMWGLAYIMRIEKDETATH